MSGRGGIRLAVQGVGLIGRRHAEHIAACPQAVLHALVDPSPAAAAVAAEFGVPHYPGFEDMCAAGRPDGVVIATPNQLHVAHGLDCVRAGIAALVEKPIADDIAGATVLVETAERAGVPLLVGHHRRYNPMIQHAKAMLDAGRIGRLVAVHGFFWLMKPDDYFNAPWRRAPGAGPVLLNLIHDIDLLRYLCGEITSVQAMAANAVRGFAVEDTAAILLRFANGALGTVTVSDTVVAPWSWEQTTGENPIYPHTDQACYHLAGTHGALAVPKLDLWRNPVARGWWEAFEVERATVPPADPLQRQIAHFCAVIRGDETPLVSGREGLRSLRVIAAVQDASRSGGTVRLD